MEKNERELKQTKILKGKKEKVMLMENFLNYRRINKKKLLNNWQKQWQEFKIWEKLFLKQ